MLFSTYLIICSFRSVKPNGSCWSVFNQHRSTSSSWRWKGNYHHNNNYNSYQQTKNWRRSSCGEDWFNFQSFWGLSSFFFENITDEILGFAFFLKNNFFRLIFLSVSERKNPYFSLINLQETIADLLLPCLLFSNLFSYFHGIWY